MDERIKARLVTKLYAEETLVAESDDPLLWQRTLAAISGCATASPSQSSGRDQADEPDLAKGVAVSDGAAQPVQRLASELKIESAVLAGALGPSSEPPYLHIDSRYWEAFKKVTPDRGRGAMSPMRLAATAIVLWFRAAGLGSPTIGQAKAVMTAANLTEAHPSRSLDSTDWLQTRGESIILNPAAISRAEELLRAFCEKRKPNLKE